MQLSVDAELHNAQDDFFWDGTKNKALVTGRGFGKTFVFALLAITKGLQRRRGLVIAPTYTMLKDVLLAKTVELLDKYKIPFEVQKQDFILKIAGTTLYYRSAQNPDRMRGLEYNWFGIDEASQIKTDEVWRIALGGRRLGSDFQSWVTTTPKGYNWVYDKFGRGNNSEYSIHRGKSMENRHLEKDFIKSLYEDYTGSFLAQEAEGEFVSMEGQIFKQENLQFYETLSADDIRNMEIYGYLDPATGSKDGDYTAFVTAGKLAGKIYILDAVVDKLDDKQLIEVFKQKAAVYNYLTIGIESVFWQKKYVFDSIQEALPLMSLKEVRNTGRKQVRIAGIQPLVESGVLFPTGWLYERNSSGRRAMDQLFSFNLQGDYKNDDFPDALEGVLQMHRQTQVKIDEGVKVFEGYQPYDP